MGETLSFGPSSFSLWYGFIVTYMFKTKIIFGSVVVLTVGHSGQLKTETLKRKAVVGLMKHV